MEHPDFWVVWLLLGRKSSTERHVSRSVGFNATSLLMVLQVKFPFNTLVQLYSWGRTAAKTKLLNREQPAT